jgi:uncharacterized membrane protein YjfL (UPF0719 family)
MDFAHGILFLFIGCTVTLVISFTAFLIINYNIKKEKERIEQQNKPKVHPYGDDTV